MRIHQQLLCLCLIGIHSTASADFLYESSYSYNQNGNATYSGSEPGVPQNINTTATTPISTYKFDVQTIPSTFTELKAKAGFTVDIDQRNSDISWFDLDVTATAKSSLTDFGFVQGAPGTPGGVIQITWAVSGASDILFDATGPNALFIEKLSTLGLLTSSVPTDRPDLFLNDQGNRTISGTGPNPIIESVVPDSSGFQTFVVDWTAGEQVQLFFELLVSAKLDVFNADAAGFKADVSGDFSNTATLQSVVIYDQNGNVLEDATLIGEEGFDYVNQEFVDTEPETPDEITIIEDGNKVIVWGTSGADHIVLEEWEAGFAYVLDVNAGYEVLGVLDLSVYESIHINAGDGNDIIENHDVNILFFVNGGDGNDDLYGSELAEGYDDLDGGDGDDFIYGGAGFEFLQGGEGNDYMKAGPWNGNEVSKSTIIGGAGQDTMIGTPFNDTIVAEDGEHDYIDCNGGEDDIFNEGSFDAIDELVNCELLDV